MPITFSCACGKTLRVGDEHAGKRVKCPACQTIGSVPAPRPEPEPEPVFEVVEPAPRPVAAPRPKRPWDDDEDEGGSYGMAGRAARDDGEPEVGTYGVAKPAAGDEGPRDKPLPDFRLGSGQRGKKRKKK
jgi:hypothetical protein